GQLEVVGVDLPGDRDVLGVPGAAGRDDRDVVEGEGAAAPLATADLDLSHRDRLPSRGRRPRHPHHAGRVRTAIGSAAAHPVADRRHIIHTGSVSAADPVRMPIRYLSHGAPPLADDARWAEELSSWSAQPPTPRNILMVSAHWENAPLSLSATRRAQPLVYDF